jgi:hypothetical protein
VDAGWGDDNGEPPLSAYDPYVASHWSDETLDQIWEQFAEEVKQNPTDGLPVGGIVRARLWGSCSVELNRPMQALRVPGLMCACTERETMLRRCGPLLPRDRSKGLSPRMLTDIFLNRYAGVPLWERFEEKDRRFLVQAFRIISEQLHLY